jgi:hypothetical protein
MTLIPELERSLVNAISSKSPRRARRWRRLPLTGIAFIAVVGTTGALAATGVIGFGSPVGVPHVLQTPAAASNGFGVVRSASAKLVATAPDPAGGLKWGMRLATTSRGGACLEVGREEDGQIGVLGIDNAFHDDGRFHTLPAKLSSSSSDCGSADRSGVLFHSVTATDEPASGVDASGLWITVGDCLPPRGVAHGSGPYCKGSDERNLYYGALGPDALSLTYTGDGGTKTLNLATSDGMYLIVEGASGDTYSGYSDGLLPGPPILSVTYRGGLRCNYSAVGQPSKACRTPPGYVPPALPHYTHAQIAAPIQVAIGPNNRINGLNRSNRLGYSVSFVARAPVTNALSGYVVQLGLSHGCGGMGVSSSRNVTRGQRVTYQDLPLPAKPGPYQGAVYFASSTQGGPAGLSSPRGGRQVLVGRFTLIVPRHYVRPGSASGCS